MTSGYVNGVHIGKKNLKPLPKLDPDEPGNTPIRAIRVPTKLWMNFTKACYRDGHTHSKVLRDLMERYALIAMKRDTS